MTAPRSLELFFVDGRPDGMLTVEVFNWTGHVLRIPRTQIKQGLSRTEAARTGVYVLLGTDGDHDMAYIGEAEDMRMRLAQHVAGKEWWDTAILISTTGDALHKAHAKYLESRLVEIAREVGSMTLENASTPPRSSLTEAAQANMESFLDTLGIVLPAIRVDMFLKKSRPAAPVQHTTDAPTFILRNRKHGLEARAVLIDGEMVVTAGSAARNMWAGQEAAKTHYFKLHAELLANGTLRPGPDNASFAKAYAFSSPSAAAAIVNGRASNGRLDWRLDPTGETLAEWEKSQLEGTL